DKASLGWLAASMVAMPFAAMTAFQSVLLVPVLGVYLWRERRTWRPAWAALLVIPLVFGGWQLWERSGSEQIPAGTLVAYFRKYGWQSLANKGKNAVTLTAHLGLLGLAAFLRPSFPQAAWIGGIAVVTGLALDPHPLFVIPFAGGVMVVAWCIRHRDDFLAQWTLLFFAAALVIFFAGSARYLLPLAAPVVFLSVRLLSARPKILWGAAAANLSVSLALASVNYQQWNACKEFVKAAGIEDQTARVWVNSEHGLRFYAESAGAVPLERGQSIRPGEFLLANRLASRVPFTTGGSALVPLREMVVTSAIPLRIVGAGAKSGYSTSEMGFRVFDWNSGPIDVIRLDRAVERKPVLSYLPMNAAEAASQIVSGVENLEENRYRWMGKRAVLLLKRPPAATPIEIEFFLHEKATAKNMIVSLDGKQIANEPLTQGARTIRMGPYMPAGETATLIIEVDNTFSVPGDQRVLGAILIGAGFR
ncbi:MAG: hypothetical protein HYZ37_04815, partial [Candidatus Solibacter usitatus]|nr:hypothetical protein [Candidatus Solibacter usitatus]